MSGACCQSGFVDECGVCDGDSSSCQLNLILRLPVTALASSSWQAALQALVEAAVAAAHAPAKVVAAVQLAEGSGDGDGVPLGAVRVLQEGGQEGVGQAAELISNGPAGTAGPAPVAQDGGVSEGPAQEGGYCERRSHPGSWEGSLDAAGVGGSIACSPASRRALQAVSSPPAAADNSTQANTTTAAVQVQLAFAASAAAAAASMPGAALQPFTLTALASPLLAALQAQLANSSAIGGAAAAGPRVTLMERMGVCGNGVCEVGERQLQDAWGASLHVADAPCPQVGGATLLCGACCAPWLRL